MIIFRTITIAGVLAAGLAACATSPAPLSVEEQVGFDKATGADITGVPPGLRLEAAGYRPFVIPGPPPP